MRYIFTALFILYLAANCIAGINTWTQCSGTDGFAIDALLLDTTTTGRIYAGTDGLLISNDFGTTWIFSSITLAAPNTGIESIAVNPKFANIVYAYVPNNYMCVIESTTYGYGNWTTTTNDLYSTAVPNLLIDPENVGRMYAASLPDGYPIQISDDTGITWTPSYSGISTDEASSYLIMHPTQHNILYAGADATPGIYVSYNGSTTWQSLPLDLPVRSLAIDPTNPNNIYAGGDTGFASSFDGGSTWNICADTTITSYVVKAILVNALNPEIIYVGTDANGMFKSNDRGNTWYSMQTGLTSHRIWSLAYDTITQTLFAGTEGLPSELHPNGIWMYQDTDLTAVEDWEIYGW